MLPWQALTSDVSKNRGGRFDHFYLEPHNTRSPTLTMEMSVIVFDSGLSVPDDARPWIVAGDFHFATLQRLKIKSPASHDCMPWEA